MQPIKRLAILGFIMFLLSVSTVEADNSAYYVSMNGNDQNPCTLVSPCRTIQRAANIVQAGETVYIREGVYNEKVTPKYSGTAGKYITY